MTTVIKTKQQKKVKSLSTVLGEHFKFIRTHEDERSISIACTPESLKNHPIDWHDKARERVVQVAKECGLTIATWEDTTVRGMTGIKVGFLETIAAFANNFQAGLREELPEALKEDGRFKGKITSLRVKGVEKNGKIIVQYACDEDNENASRASLRAVLRHLLRGSFDKHPSAFSSPVRIGNEYIIEVMYKDITE